MNTPRDSQFDPTTIYIALENIRSLYNVGAILRSCSFFNFRKVLLIGYSGKQRSLYDTTYHLHEKIEKTALGSEHDLEITLLNDTQDLLTFAKQHNLSIHAIEQDTRSIPLHKWQPHSNTILVLGHEREGVSSQVLKSAHRIIEIPKKGIHHSLNVSTTAGVVLFYLATKTDK